VGAALSSACNACACCSIDGQLQHSLFFLERRTVLPPAVWAWSFSPEPASAGLRSVSAGLGPQHPAVPGPKRPDSVRMEGQRRRSLGGQGGTSHLNESRTFGEVPFCQSGATTMISIQGRRPDVEVQAPLKRAVCGSRRVVASTHLPRVERASQSNKSSQSVLLVMATICRSAAIAHPVDAAEAAVPQQHLGQAGETCTLHMCIVRRSYPRNHVCSEQFVGPRSKDTAHNGNSAPNFVGTQDLAVC
jgi:hypothetical protein